MICRGYVVLIGGKIVFCGSPINDLSCSTSISLPKSLSCGTHVLPNLQIKNGIPYSQVKMIVPPHMIVLAEIPDDDWENEIQSYS
jgi:hypothetical protein